MSSTDDPKETPSKEVAAPDESAGEAADAGSETANEATDASGDAAKPKIGIKQRVRALLGWAKPIAWRVWRRGRVPAALLALLLLLMTTGAKHMIAAARDAHASCRRADYSGQPGDSVRCQGRSRYWLILPWVSPWYRAEAIALSATMEREEAARAAMLSCRVELDADVRELRLRELEEISDGHDDVSSDSSIVLASAFDCGARDLVARMAARARTAVQAQGVMQAAIGAAELDIAANIATQELGRDGQLEHRLMRGALLCLHDRPELGRQLLTAAVAWSQQREDAEPTSPLQALLLCGQRELPAAVADQPSVQVSQAIGNPDDAQLDRLLSPTTPPHPAIARNRAQLFSYWLTRAERQPTDVVDQAALLEVSVVGALTPWMAVRTWDAGPERPQVPLLAPPTILEEAATQLDRWIEASQNRRLRVDSMPPFERWPPGFQFSRYDAIREARRNPLPRLRRASLALRISAIAAWLVMFEDERAARVAQLVHRDLAVLSPSHREWVTLLTAVAFIRAEQTDDARNALAPLAESEQPTIQILALLNRGLVEWAANEPSAAHDAAAEAYAKCEPLRDRPPRPSAVGPSPAYLCEAAAWLTLATSIRNEDLDSAPDWMTPQVSESLAYTWIRLLRSPERERAAYRLRLSRQPIDGARAVLPAYVYVWQEIAGEGDADVWIDYLFGLDRPELNGITGMFARAEAFRYRGMYQRQAKWEGRARRLLDTIESPTDAWLARLAQLDG